MTGIGHSLRAIGVVFANPNLRRLQLAWAGSVLGSYAYVVAIAVVAFRSGGAGAVGVLILVRLVAAAVASPLLSVLADRYQRRLVMVVTDLVRAALMLGVGVLVEVHAPAISIYVLAVLISIVGTAFRPAQGALVPSLAATPEQLTTSNALAGTIEGAGLFLGPGIGGLVLAVSGPAAVFAVCVVAFLWSALLVWRIDEPARTAEVPDADGEAHTGLTAGLRTIASAPALVAVTLTYAAQCAVAGALGVFTVVLAIDALDLGNAGVGYLDSAFGVGGVLGGVIATGFSGTRRLAAVFALGVAGWGAGIALVGATSSVWIALVLLAGVGVSNTIVDVTAVTLLQRSAPDAVLGRVLGVLESVLLASMGIGSVLAPVAIHVLGIRTAMVVAGLALPVVVALSARTLIRLDSVEPEIAKRVALARAHSIFAPLAEATLEQLARHMEPLAVAARDQVIRQGDAGDHVYLVASGELAVDVDGRAGSPLSAGDLFGEIALLRDVPRTASVHAQTACDLLTLGRDEFLAAVTGHPRSAAEADVVVSTRLGALRPGVVTA